MRSFSAHEKPFNTRLSDIANAINFRKILALVYIIFFTGWVQPKLVLAASAACVESANPPTASIGNPSGADSVACGQGATASGNRSIALGNGATASNEQATAIGRGARATQSQAVAIGAGSVAAFQASAFGNDTTAAGDGSIAFGGDDSRLNTGYSNNVEIGARGLGVTNGRFRRTTTYGSGSTAIAVHSQALSKGSVAIGVGATAGDGGVRNTGWTNTLANQNIEATAIGALSYATSERSTAVGAGAKSIANNAFAAGTNAQAVTTNSIAIGKDAVSGSGTVGNLNEKKETVAIGKSANASGSQAISIGSGSIASETASVALGADSVANTAAGVQGYDPLNRPTAPTGREWVSTLGAVSIGNGTNTRQITNLAAGKNDTDAVNVAQLKQVTQLATSSLTIAGDTGTQFTRKLGQTINIKGGESNVNKLSNGNIGVAASGTDTLNIKLAKELRNLTSVQTGNAQLNTDGLSITGGPRVLISGINAGGKKITNVASNLTTISGTGGDAGLLNLSNLTIDQQGSAVAGRDLTNLGWVISSNKTTGSLSTAYNGQVKNANEVKFVGTGGAVVSGATIGNVHTITVGVDANSIASGAQLAVNYTLTDGTKLYFQSTGINANKFTTNADGTGAVYDPANVADASKIIASMNNGGNSTKTAMRLTNIGSGLVKADGTTAINLSEAQGTNAVTIADLRNDKLKMVFTGNTNADTGNNGSQQALGSRFKVLGSASNQTLSADTSGDSTAGNYSAKNVQTVVTDGQVQIQLADNPEFNSVVAGNGANTKVTIGDSGLKIGNATYITSAGLNANNQYITNVKSSISDQTGATFADKLTAAATNASTQNNAVNVSDLSKALSNVNSSLTNTGLKFGANIGTTHKAKLGSTINIKGGSNNTAWGDFDAGSNIMTQVKGNTVTVALKKDIDVTSVKIGTGANTTQLTSTAVGLNVGGDKVTNIGQASLSNNSTDAVRADQLYSTGNSLAKLIGGSATKINPTTGEVVFSDTANNGIGGTGKNNIHDAIKSINATAGSGFKIAGNSDVVGTPDKTIAPNNTFTIAGAVGNTDFNQSDAGQNIYTQVSDKKVTVALAKNITGINSVSAATFKSGNSTMNTNGVTIKGGPSITTTGVDAGDKKITSVAAGTVGAGSTDAVNGDQLNQAINTISADMGSVYQAVGRVENNSNAGIASAIAVANLPQPHDPGASMTSLAVGNYKGESAMSFGLSTISDNGKWVIKGSFTQDTQENRSYGAGVGFQW